MVKLAVKIVNREPMLLITDSSIVLPVKQVILMTMFRSVDIRNLKSVSTWFLFIKVTELGPAQKCKKRVRSRYNYYARFFYAELYLFSSQTETSCKLNKIFKRIPGGVCYGGVPGPGVCLVPGGLLPGGVPGPRPAPGGGGVSIPPCTEADPPGRDGYCCGRYASYWNAFLFHMRLMHRLPLKNGKETTFFYLNKFMFENFLYLNLFIRNTSVISKTNILHTM